MHSYFKWKRKNISAEFQNCDDIIKYIYSCIEIFKHIKIHHKLYLNNIFFLAMWKYLFQYMKQQSS